MAVLIVSTLAGSRDLALSPHSLTGTGRHADQLTVRVLDAGHYLPQERPNTVAAAIRTMTAPRLGLPAPVNEKNG